VFGRDGRAGGCDVLVEVPLAVVFMLGKVDEADDSVEVLAIEHQLCGPNSPACAFLTCATCSFPWLRGRHRTHLERERSR
jgi:hypothetical protein